MTIRARMAADDWQNFADKLADVLERLDEGQFLILSLKDRNLFVQAVAQGNHGLRLETTSNEYRSDDDQLSETEIATLEKMGWRSPTRPDSRPDNDPFGSPNFYLDTPQPVDFDALAALMVNTLKLIGAADPAELQYEGDDGNGNPLSLPNLGVMAVADHSQQILQAVREITGQEQVSIDADGDIGPILMGQSVTYLMIINDNKNLRIFSRVMERVAESYELLKLLNTLNGERGDVHFYYQDGIILAMADVPIAPFVKLHLARVLPDFCEFVDNSISVLEAELDSAEAVAH
jgi:hypothetical protein